jgi:hypothetical protein
LDYLNDSADTQCPAIADATGRTVNIEIDARATGTHRLSLIPIRSSEHIRFYQAFDAIIFDAAEQ